MGAVLRVLPSGGVLPESEGRLRGGADGEVLDEGDALLQLQIALRHYRLHRSDVSTGMGNLKRSLFYGNPLSGSRFVHKVPQQRSGGGGGPSGRTTNGGAEKARRRERLRTHTCQAQLLSQR